MTGATLPLLVVGALPLIVRDAGALARIDPDDDRQARPQPAQFGGVIFKDDAHRHTLHDLGEIPVAFSGGMTLNWAPVAGAKLATRP
jgi:hypothetical protein